MAHNDWNDLTAALSGIAGRLAELGGRLEAAAPEMPAYEVLYGPAGAVVADLSRARLEMSIVAHAGRRPSDPELN